MTSHPACCYLPRPELTSLYLHDKMTAEDIARRYTCSATTVRRWLRRFEIPVRRPGPIPAYFQQSRAAGLWSTDMAYVVGLMATDGNLARRRPALTLVSRDIRMLETVRRCLSLTVSVTRHGQNCLRLQWCDRRLYRWLLDTGLTPAKSLTLGPLDIPDEYFADFFRGCVDGDGSVLVYTDRHHTKKKESYVYDRLYLSVVSASRPFLDWLQASNQRLAGVSGDIQTRNPRGRHRPLWLLRYAKRESITLIRWMYHSPDLPCLERKRVKAERFLAPLGHARKGAAGRPRVGWIYNEER